MGCMIAALGAWSFVMIIIASAFPPEMEEGVLVVESFISVFVLVAIASKQMDKEKYEMDNLIKAELVDVYREMVGTIFMQEVTRYVMRLQLRDGSVKLETTTKARAEELAKIAEKNRRKGG